MSRIDVLDEKGRIHRIEDLTGQRFNKLTVDSFDKLLLRPSGNRMYWNCTCDCGKKLSVRSDGLKNGSVKSCGCAKIHDLTGKKFGYLTPIKIDRHERNIIYWRCLCDCGNETVVAAGDLIKGSTRSCGCKKRQLISEAKHMDLTGQRFGRLVAKKFMGMNEHGSQWLCRCDCGKEIVTLLGSLRSGSAQSCGCRQRELTSLRNKLINTKYITDDERRIAAIMGHMRQRCYNPKCDRYSDWGGRGIRICDEWLADTQNFVKWSLAHGYKPGYSINRIINDGNYCPGNCNWIPKPEQSRNTRKTVRIIVGDVTDLILEDWRKLIPTFSSWVGYRYTSEDRKVLPNGEKEPAFTPEQASQEISFILGDFAKTRGLSIETTPVSELLKMYVEDREERKRIQCSSKD